MKARSSPRQLPSLCAMLALALCAWLCPTSTHAQSAAESNLVLLDTENPDIEKLVVEVNEALGGQNQNGLDEIRKVWDTSKIRAGAAEPVDPASHYGIMLTNQERNKRGVFFSQGVNRGQKDFPIHGSNHYYLHFPLLRRVDGGAWQMSQIGNTDQSAGSLFMMNAGRFQELPTRDWTIDNQTGGPSLEFTTGTSDVFQAEDVRTAFNDELNESQEPAQVFKRYEFPRQASDLDTTGGLSLDLEFAAVQQDYRHLDPNATKLVVVLHGWNPDGDEDMYSENETKNQMAVLLSDIRKDMQSGAALGVTGWDLYAYNWAEDATTGPVDIGHPHEGGWRGSGQENGTQAAEAGYQHGLILGKLMREKCPNLEKIHIIAHSAGTWVARSLSLYLAAKAGAAIEQQVTLLDPYIPHEGFVEWVNESLFDGGEDSPLSAALVTEWHTHVDPPRMENIYSDDSAVKGTNERFWNELDSETIDGHVLANLQVGRSLLGEPGSGGIDGQAWNGHGGPMLYYAWTANPSNTANHSTTTPAISSVFWLLSLAETAKGREYAEVAGWKHGLFRKDFDLVLALQANTLVINAQIKSESWATYGTVVPPPAASFVNGVETGSAPPPPTWEQVAVHVDGEGFVWMILLPSDPGEKAVATSPVRIEPDGSFVAGGESGLDIVGQFDLGATPPTLSLTIDGSPFASGIQRVVGSSPYAGVPAVDSVPGAGLFSLVLKDGTMLAVLEGIDENGERWQGAGTGTVNGTGLVQLTGENGFAINGQLTTGGSSLDAPIVTPPAGVVTASITPASQPVPVLGETYQIQVTSNGPWAVQEDLTWLSAAPLNGTGDGIVTVTVAANTSSSQRQGNITIGGQTHSVVQAGVPISLPTVADPTVTGITTTTATLGGNVTSDGGTVISERGVVYSATASNNNPLIGDPGVTKVATTGTTGVFTTSVTGLTPSTGYSYKAYATNSQGTSYTSVGNFTTLSANADLASLALSSGTLSPAFASGTTSYTASVANAISSITVTPTAAQANATIAVRVNGGGYASVVSGSASGALALNVGSNTVDVRVTAQAGNTRTYTVTVTRAAALAAPTVTSSTATSVSATGATLGGNVTSDGGAAITERGVVYSATATNSDPLIGGTGVTNVTTTGTTGVFTVAVTGLTQGTAYSYKAYATNNQGTSYTTPVSTFTTTSNTGSPIPLYQFTFDETLAEKNAMLPNVGTSGSISYVDGARGKALRLNEFNSYGTLPAVDFSAMNATTVAGWVKEESVISDGTFYFFWGDERDTFKHLGFGHLQQSLGFGPVDAWVPYEVGWQNVWAHFAVVHTETTSALFVNGIKVKEVNQTESKWKSNAVGYLGGHRNSQYGNFLSRFQGSVDDLIIYDRALSASEIATIAGVVTPPSYAYFLSNESGSNQLWRGTLEVDGISNRQQLTQVASPGRVEFFRLDPARNRIGLVIFSGTQSADGLFFWTNPDGTGLSQVSSFPVSGPFAYSPDHSEIVIAKGVNSAGGNVNEAYRMNLTTGAATLLLAATEPRGTATHKTWFEWLADGRILFADTRVFSDYAGQHDLHLWDNGVITSLASNTAQGDATPLLSPDGTKLLVSHYAAGGGTQQIAYIQWPTDTGRTVILPWSNQGPAANGWLDNETVLFQEAGELYSIKLDGTQRSNLTNTPGVNEFYLQVWPATTPTPSSNANLSNLALSAGTLNPAFGSAITTYTTSVANAVSSITVTPTASQTAATIAVRINGSSYANVTSGSPSGALALNVGGNTVDARVTAQDGTTIKTYSVMVTRAAAITTPTVTTPTAASITATGATLGGNVTSDGGAAITERGVVYSVTATNNNPLIGGTGVVKVTTTGTTGVFTVPVTGLTQGSGYSYKAYAINSQGASYTSVTAFTTLSTNADLSQLVLSAGSLSPMFAPTTTTYSASVPNATSSITVTPTRAHANATIAVRVNGGTYAAVTSGSASGALALNVGSNTVEVWVTAQDTTTQKLYTLTLTRAAAITPPTVTTPTAASITATGATLGGNVTNDGGAAIIERGIVYSITATNNNPLIGDLGVVKVATTGSTGVFTVPVTALSPETAYSFRPYAANSQFTTYAGVAAFTTLSSNADLGNLTLSNGILNPSFVSATTSYMVSVANVVNSITVTPTAVQANATIAVRVNGGSYANVTSGSTSGTLALNVGDNTVDVHVTAQDGTITKTYTVTVTRLAPTNAPDWQVPVGRENSMTVYAQVENAGARIDAPGSMLAVFEGGVVAGVATSINGPAGLFYQLTVWSNLAAVGNLPLKVYDSATGEIHDIKEKVNFIANGVLGLINAPVHFTVQPPVVEQVVPLVTGWNWLSFNALPETPTVTNVLGAYTAQDNDLIKGVAGSATYFGGAWFPATFAIEPGKMYMLRRQQAGGGNFTVTGPPADPTHTLSLVAGWNWLGYIPQEGRGLGAALDSLTLADNDLVKSQQDGTATFFGGQWFPGTVMIQPGRGYLLRLAQAQSFAYDGMAGASAAPMAFEPEASETASAAPGWMAPVGKENSMTVYAAVQIDGAPVTATGSLLAAFDGADVAGVAEVMDGPVGKLFQLTIWSDSASKSGLSLRVYDGATGAVRDIEGPVDFATNAILGGIATPLVFSAVPLVASEFEFSSHAFKATGNPGSVELEIIRTVGTSPASVSLSTSDGMAGVVPPFAAAVAGVDYTAVNTVVNFAQGEMSKTLPVTLISRTGKLPNRRFLATLSNPSNGTTLGSINIAEVRLLVPDTTKPVLVITSPIASAKIVGLPSPFFAFGTAGDAQGIDRVEMEYDGETFTTVPGLGGAAKLMAIPWAFEFTPKSEGPVSLIFTAYDFSGNSTTVRRAFSYERRYEMKVLRSVPDGVPPDKAGTVSVKALPAKDTALMIKPNLTGLPAALIPPSWAVKAGTQVSVTAIAKTGYVFSHWQGLPTGAVLQGHVATFAMPAEDVPELAAVFVVNPFTRGVFAALGTKPLFQGLLRPNEMTLLDNSTVGFVTSALVPSTGSLSGKIWMGGLSASFTGVLHGDGSVWFTVAGKRTSSQPFQGCTLTMTWSEAGLAMITTGVGNKISRGLARPALYTKTHLMRSGLLDAIGKQGFYNLALPALEQLPAKPTTLYPQGTGTAGLTLLSNGTFKLAGTLAEGTKVTAAGYLVLGDAAEVFIALPTPGGRTMDGSLLGTLVFDETEPNSDVSSTDLTWFRPVAKTKANVVQAYRAGWPDGLTLGAVGALYDKTLPMQGALGIGAVNSTHGNALLTFTGGKLVAESLEVSNFNVSASKIIKIPTGDKSFTLTLTQATGLMSGTFTPDWTQPNRSLPKFQGVLLQKGAFKGGHGFFLSNRLLDLTPESGAAGLGSP